MPTLPNITPEAWFTAKCEAREVQLALQSASTLEIYVDEPGLVAERRSAAITHLGRLAAALGYELSPRVEVLGEVA